MLNSSLHQKTPIGTKIVRNAVFGGLRVVLVAPIPLLLTPFIIKRVGTQGLGMWAVFIAINNLTTLADFGILGTLTRHVSEHFTKRDYSQLNKTLNSGLAMFVGIAVVCGCAMVFASNLIISTFFQHAPASWIQLEHALWWLAAAIGLNLLAFPFNSVSTGLQRLDFTNLLAAGTFAVTALLAALFLAAGFGITGFAYAIVLASALNLICNIAVAMYLLPELRLSPRSVEKAEIRSLFSFSVQMYLTQVAVAVNAQVEKFLLAHFSGLNFTGRYDIANDLSAKARSFPSLLLAPLLPAATELEARQDQSRQMELYYRTHKYLAFLATPIAVLTAVLAERFVELWLGPGFSMTATALAILTSVNLFNLTCAPAALVFIAKATLTPGVRSAIYGIFSNLIVSTILIMRFGFAGAVFGTSFSVITASCYLLWMFHRETRYSGMALGKAYLKPLLWAVLLALPLHFLIRSGQPGWVGLIALALLFMALYSIGLMLLHYFDAFDLLALERIIRVPKVVRKIVLFA